MNLFNLHLNKIVFFTIIFLFTVSFFSLAEGHSPSKAGKPGAHEECLAAQTNNQCNIDIILQTDSKGRDFYFLPRILNISNNSTIVWENHDNVTHNISGLTSKQLESSLRSHVKKYGIENTLMVDFDSGDIKPGERFELTVDRPGYFEYYDKYYPRVPAHVFVYPETTQMNVEIEPVLSTSTIQNKWITGIAFTPDGRMFFTELLGDVKIFDDGKVLDTPFVKLNEPQFFPNEDGKTPLYDGFPVISYGWLGVAIDPNYEKNNYVYLTRMFKVLDGGDPKHSMFHTQKMQLVRFTDVNNTATDVKILIDDIGGTEHQGGPIKFGKDGKIYVPTGDNANPIDSQNVSKLTGKILRINPDGTIPEDNPFKNSPVFAYGFRNVFGIDSHPITGEFFVAENGPDRGDEINRLIPGKNYGWPVFIGDFLVVETMLKEQEEYIGPIWEWQQVLGPSNAIFYRGEELDVLKNNFLVGTWNLGTLRMFTFNDDNETIQSEKLLFSGYKLVIALAESPEGYVYFSTIGGIERITNVTNENMKDTEKLELRYSKSNKDLDSKMPVSSASEKLISIMNQSYLTYIAGIILASLVGFFLFYLLKVKKIHVVRS